MGFLAENWIQRADFTSDILAAMVLILVFKGFVSMLCNEEVHD